ncbi:5'/3'-nucleotidase SurE [Alphaproteobacteria bacterium]|nr:5'/3'-nucleotidase SurE [Alphaproteobacteria bacterium]
MDNFIKKILITNDDGFDAIGLKILKNIASKFSDDITVVSPKYNQSAKSRSITLKDKVSFEQKDPCEWIVDGTPTDCIIFALNHIMKINKPDLILSGINAGSNIGDEVSYSGTVAAAMEGALRGINSIALSQFGGNDKASSYLCSENNCFDIINLLLNLESNSPIYFNVNFPLSIYNNYKKFSYTKLASQKKSDEIFVDNSKKSYKLGRMLNNSISIPETDMQTLTQDMISITPLTLDLTNTLLFNDLNKR